MLRILLCLCMLTPTFWGSAKNLRPQDLKITLDKLPVLEYQSEIIPLQIKIENLTSHRGSIIIPYSQNFGKSLFTLLIYEIETDGKYRLVYTSPTEINMDTTRYRTEGSFWSLEPNEHFISPLFVNDTKNARLRFESSFQFPDLNTGKYALQVLYTPENSSYFKYAFREKTTLDPIPEDAVADYPDHFIWEGSFASNMFEFSSEIKPKQGVSQPKSSAVCSAIFKQKWNKVKRLWDQRKKEKPCDCVLWLYDWPQAVQSSLPTFAGYDAIFWTNEGIKYVYFDYQLGKIYRVRSRAAWLFYAVGFRRAPFKTSKVNWSKLIGVKPL